MGKQIHVQGDTCIWCTGYNDWRRVDNEQDLDETSESWWLIVPVLFLEIVEFNGIASLLFLKSLTYLLFCWKNMWECLWSGVFDDVSDDPGLCRNWFALRNTTSWLLALLWSLYFRRWSASVDVWAAGLPRKDVVGFLQVELTPLSHIELYIPIKHTNVIKCSEQPWQETTAVDVWLRPLSFSPRPLDPPLKSTSTDCWAFAWDWQWATFPPCWPLVAISGRGSFEVIP